MCRLEWDRALLMMPMTCSADVSMPSFEPQENILNIDCDTNQSNCLLSLNLLLNKTLNIILVF